MKIAVIGAGNVGKTIFYDLQHVNMVSEIVLVDRKLERARAEVMDARDAAVLREAYSPKLYCGGYEATKDADIIIYTAGSAKMGKPDRMEMLRINCAIAEDVFTEIMKYNRNAIIICVSNPLDAITMKIRQVTGQDPHRVIGSGTLLESASMRPSREKLSGSFTARAIPAPEYRQRYRGLLPPSPVTPMKSCRSPQSFRESTGSGI